MLRTSLIVLMLSVFASGSVFAGSRAAKLQVLRNLRSAQFSSLEMSKRSCRNIGGEKKTLVEARIDGESFFLVDGIEYGLDEDQWSIGPMGSKDPSSTIFFHRCDRR